MADEKRLKHAEQMRKWRANNPGRHAENVRKWKAKNSERDKANMDNWLAEHPGYRANQMREWRASHPGRHNENVRKWREENTARAIFTSYKASAKRQKRTFLLTLQWIENKLAAGICERTGIPFSFKRGDMDPLNGRNVNPWFPSIDRIDSSFGYLETNCQMVCVMYNTAKNNWSDADVLKMAKGVVNHESR